MSDDSRLNTAVNAAATIKIHHANLQDLSLSTARRLYKGGIRPGEVARSRLQAQEMLGKIPPSQRVGIDGKSAASNTKHYLSDKHASHIQPHSQGGSNLPHNIKWESGKDNMARGNKTISYQEEMSLNLKWHFDNMTGAVKAGIQAAPRGVLIGAITTLPFSILTNALRVVRGEIDPEVAAMETLKDTVVGGAVGGTTAFVVTTIAAACPPIAIALTATAPILAVVGTAGMVYEFFKILDDHKEAVRRYYASLTKQELSRLQAVEDELVYEHKKNLEFLAETEKINQEIINRPVRSGVDRAIQRLHESATIAKSLGLTSTNSQLLTNSQLS